MPDIYTGSPVRIVGVDGLPVAGALGGAATSATQSVVAASASSVTLLAAGDASRRGVTIFNDCDKPLYVKFGAVAATTTNFNAKVAAGANYEVPMGWYGEIRGIWDAAPVGNARITVYT